MDTITVNRSKPTKVEFDMRVDGASIDDARVKFTIKCEGYDISFDCERTSQDTFTADVPPLPFLDKGVHDCCVDVIINGQFFKPLKGNAIIADNVKVTASLEPFKSDETPEKKTEEEENTISDKAVEKDLEGAVASGRAPTPITPFALAKYLQNRDVADEHEEVSESEKDVKVRQILESMHITTSKQKTTKKSRSLKNITAEKRASKSTK